MHSDDRKSADKANELIGRLSAKKKADASGDSDADVIDENDATEPEIPAGFVPAADVFVSPTDHDASGPLPKRVNDSQPLTPVRGISKPLSDQDTGEFTDAQAASAMTIKEPGPPAVHAPTVIMPQQGSGSSVKHGDAKDLPKEIEVSGFKDIKFIAQGADGAVYQATNELMDSTTALKFLRGYDESKLGRFAKEAAVIRSLDSIPNVVRVYNFAWGEISFLDATGSKRKVKIPYLEQGLMHHALKERLDANEKLTLEETVNKGIELARALQKIHDKGIIHRDLKPANILEDEDCKAYISDVGIALVRGTGQAEQEKGLILGTPHYLSPEQAAGDVDQVDNRSDVYGLGAIIYELVTGVTPQFVDISDSKRILKLDSVIKIVRAVQTNSLAPVRMLNKKIPRDLADIVEKAMAKERWVRYACAADFADDLERFKKGIPPKASKKWIHTRFIQHLYARKIKTVAAAALIGASVYAYDLYEKSIIVEENKNRIREIAKVELEEAQDMRERASASNNRTIVLSAVLEYDQAVSSLEQLSGVENDPRIAVQINELKSARAELANTASRLERSERIRAQELHLESLFGAAQEQYDEFKQAAPQDQIAAIDSIVKTLGHVRDEAVKIESESGAQRIALVDRLIAQARSSASVARVNIEREELASTAQQRYDSAFTVYRDIDSLNVLEQYDETRSALDDALQKARDWKRSDEENTVPDNLILSLQRTLGELDGLHSSVQDSARRAERAQSLAELAQREADSHDYAAARQNLTEAESLSQSPDVKQMLDRVVQLHERYQIERVQHAYESIFEYQKQVTNIWTDYYRAQIRSSVRDRRLTQARESLESQLECPSRNGEEIAELSHTTLDRDYFDGFTDTQTHLAEESTRLLIDTDRAQQVRLQIERRDAVWRELQDLNGAYVRGDIQKEDYNSRSAELTRELRGE